MGLSALGLSRNIVYGSPDISYAICSRYYNIIYIFRYIYKSIYNNLEMFKYLVYI